MTEHERRTNDLDRAAPADPEAAQATRGERRSLSDDPQENLDRAIETGEENPT